MRRGQPARVMGHDARPDRIAQLQHRPAHGLVRVQVHLVHEVDGEHAVHGVLQGAARADPLEEATALRQHAAADDQIQLVERQLAMAGAGRLDAGELGVEVGQIGPHLVGAKAKTRDRVGSVAHGFPFLDGTNAPAALGPSRRCLYASSAASAFTFAPGAGFVAPAQGGLRTRDRSQPRERRIRGCLAARRPGVPARLADRRHRRRAALARAAGDQRLRAGGERLALPGGAHDVPAHGADVPVRHPGGRARGPLRAQAPADHRSARARRRCRAARVSRGPGAHRALAHRGRDLPQRHVLGERVPGAPHHAGRDRRGGAPEPRHGAGVGHQQCDADARAGARRRADAGDRPVRGLCAGRAPVPGQRRPGPAGRLPLGRRRGRRLAARHAARRLAFCPQRAADRRHARGDPDREPVGLRLHHHGAGDRRARARPVAGADRRADVERRASAR